MIYVLAAIRIKDARVSEFLEIFKANTPHVLAEKGCIEYVPTMDIVSGLPLQEPEANTVTVVEKWQSIEDLRAHLVAPHMVAYQKKVNELVEEVSLKVLAEV